MKIFLTGGTGVLGRRVLALLVKNGLEVRVLSRSAANETIISSLGGIPVPGSLFDPEGLIRNTAGCDAFLHLATSIPKPGSKPADWALNDRIRTEGTRNLLAAAQANCISFFIQESIAFLYGNQHGKAVDALTPIAEHLPGILQSAVEMERLVRESGVAYAILRFGSLYAPDSDQTQALLDGIRSGKLRRFGTGNFFWNMIHADDAASAVVHVLLHRDRLANKILNVSDFNPISFKELLHALADATHSKRPGSIPHWMARLGLGADTYSALTASYRLNDPEALLGWRPRYPHFREGLAAVLQEEGSH